MHQSHRVVTILILPYQRTMFIIIYQERGKQKLMVSLYFWNHYLQETILSIPLEACLIRLNHHIISLQNLLINCSHILKLNLIVHAIRHPVMEGFRYVYRYAPTNMPHWLSRIIIYKDEVIMKVSFAQWYLAHWTKSQDIQSIMNLICRVSRRSCMSSLPFTLNYLLNSN
jgi:hypothetical protein